MVSMKKKRNIIPKNMRLPLILAVVCNNITYYGTRQHMKGSMHHNLSNSLDDRIPLIPWTVAIYLGCYVFWIVNYILGCRQEKKTAFRFMGADFAAKFVCFLCFMLFPTTNIRPVITGDTLWDGVMSWLYCVDAADNLFPSIHCLTSWFCLIAVRENKIIPKWYQVVSALTAVAVCISTLTTKQHVLVDVIAGIALAEGSYFFVWKSGFSEWYENEISKLWNWLMERRRVSE